MNDNSKALPLSGYRILDLSVMTAGPVGTVLLGDLGADVVKVEEPTNGDLARNLGNQFVNGESVQFLAQNRNKRSIRLDLKSQAGRDVFLKMVETADVVVENFRPGTVDRLGIGYDAAKARNSKIIYASVSAFGQSGPYAGWPANDPIVQAVTGLMDMTGEAGGNPVRVGAPLPDFGAAALLAFGVVSALLHRERHGEGQKIETSLLSAALLSTIPRDGETIRSGRSPQRLGSGHPTMVPYRNYKGSDGAYFFAACFTEKFWKNLCIALNRPDMLDDARFKDNTARTANRDDLDSILEEEFLRHPADYWVKKLTSSDVPCAKVQDYHTALTEDPQIRQVNAVVDIAHPTVPNLTNIANPVKVASSPAAYHRPPPLLGEHSEEILRDFGFTSEEAVQLLNDKVVMAMKAPLEVK